MATTNYGWTLPTVGGSEDTWGDENNTLWTNLDTLLGGVNATEFSILDGATVSTAELNYLSGVTSGVQSQINGKADTSHTHTLSDITDSGTAAANDTGDFATAAQGALADTSIQPSDTQSEATWIEGTSPTEGLVSPAKIKAAIEALGGNSFTSSAQTITSGGLVTVAHGLGVTPRFVTLRLKCLTAENGYSIGDEILLTENSSSGTTARNSAIYVDSTNVNLRFTATGTVFATANKSTGGAVAVTNGNWELYIEAMA